MTSPPMARVTGLVIVWYAAIVAANLTTAAWGADWSIVNAFLLVGLVLTTRDALDELHRRGLPAALVLQDGIPGPEAVPWDQIEAVFVGGSTEFKLGELAREIVGEATARGKWIHVGRVNSLRRIAYAKSIGANSIDGSSFSKFGDVQIPKALAAVVQGPQLRLSDVAG